MWVYFPTLTHSTHSIPSMLRNRTHPSCCASVVKRGVNSKNTLPLHRRVQWGPPGCSSARLDGEEGVMRWLLVMVTVAVCVDHCAGFAWGLDNSTAFYLLGVGELASNWPDHFCEQATNWPHHFCELATNWPDHFCELATNWPDHFCEKGTNWPDR